MTACGSAGIGVSGRDVAVARGGGGSVSGVATELGEDSLSVRPVVSRNVHTLTTITDAVTPNRTLGESQVCIHERR